MPNTMDLLVLAVSIHILPRCFILKFIFYGGQLLSIILSLIVDFKTSLLVPPSLQYFLLFFSSVVLSIFSPFLLLRGSKPFHTLVH